jgi:pimeloyl-ACP methyl ester carboxylesterase
VIAPDLLGHGKSDKPRTDYSVAAYANGLRDLLSVLGIDRVSLVGHSLGGGVAMQFAYQFPEVVPEAVGSRRQYWTGVSISQYLSAISQPASGMVDDWTSTRS